MTFKPTHNKIYILLVLALLAALLISALGVAAVQAIGVNELFDADSAENTHSDLNPGTAIACGCGDPGGSSGGCC